MAKRPIFVANADLKQPVSEVMVEFEWFAGFARVQKQRCVNAQHRVAQGMGIESVLEISSKSELELGYKLSAFHLLYEQACGYLSPVECMFQGSKRFEQGGPYTDLYEVPPRDAKRDPRLKESGELTGFELEGRQFPLEPKTLFYDWVYLKALVRSGLGSSIEHYAAFSDIEFNPKKSLNCQARSAALYVALQRLGQLDEALANPSHLAELLWASSSESKPQMELFA